ncbi:MAG: ABC transporter permease [Flavobacteriaceae bacterium]|jgi:peptide/nickel transport system permease protein|nr:ABC transporter permease [Flavobacteriaceae bacterium]
MFSFLIKKIVSGILTLFGVATVVFFLFNVLPGDPAQMVLDQNATEIQLQKVKKKYGFDKSIGTQYIIYLNDLSPVSFHSNHPHDFTFYSAQKYGGFLVTSFSNYSLVLKTPYLRTSYQRQGKKVESIISETLPNTFLLAISSICIAILLGFVFGVISGIFKGTWIDSSIQLISTVGMSLPSFFSAILFSWIFGYLLNEYTNLNMTGSLYELDDFGEGLQLQLKNLILPAFVLGIRPLAVIVQLVRSGLIEVMSQDYITTARAKGLSPLRIIYKHAIKNSLNPVITAVSGWFASMLAGAVFVEYVFGWRGLGKEIVNSLNTLDIPVVMGSVLIIATLFIIINTFVDLLYVVIDPQAKPF